MLATQQQEDFKFPGDNKVKQEIKKALSEISGYLDSIIKNEGNFNDPVVKRFSIFNLAIIGEVFGSDRITEEALKITGLDSVADSFKPIRDKLLHRPFKVTNIEESIKSSIDDLTLLRDFLNNVIEYNSNNKKTTKDRKAELLPLLSRQQENLKNNFCSSLRETLNESGSGVKKKSLDYLERIMEEVGNIKTCTDNGEVKSDAFLTDNELNIYSIHCSLTLIGQLIKDMPSEITEIPLTVKYKNKEITWNDFANLRNYLVHDYEKVDNTVVLGSARKAIELAKELEQIIIKEQKKQVNLISELTDRKRSTTPTSDEPSMKHTKSDTLEQGLTYWRDKVKDTNSKQSGIDGPP